jgi:acyl carrier protein
MSDRIQMIQQMIAQQIEEISLGQSPASTIEPQHRLIADLNLDSLDYATVLLACENELGIKVQEDGVDWAQLQSVAQLAEFLANQPARK